MESCCYKNLSLPSVLIIIIMLIYNIADTYFIGQTGNPKMISAISLSMPVFTVLSGIGTLFGNGGTTSISIALGEGNREKVQKITTFCFFGSVTVGCLFFLMIFAFTQPLALLLGADETTLSYTITYLKTFSFACPLVLFSTAFGSLLRADGDGRTALLPNMTGTISNILTGRIVYPRFSLGCIWRRLCHRTWKSVLLCAFGFSYI